MPVPSVCGQVVIEDAGVTFMARVYGNAGTAITQASLSSIGYAVTDLSDLTNPVTSGTLTISSVVFDTLQTGVRWTKDSTGYNFLYAAPATWTPSGKRRYAYVFTFTPSDGSAVLKVLFEGESLKSSY